MGKFKLAVGLHNHQPVGNFDFVFEQAHSSAYAPFLNLFQNYENIKISLHQSGILWDWQEHNHPEYLNQVKELISSGKIELLGGGFYEPILSSIPKHDIISQFALLKKYIKDKFNSEINGCWLTERIWEPHLPKVLNECGIEYLPVDDTHFIYAGVDPSKLSGPYITEHEGHAVKLLPISKKLRYLIPFGTVDELIGYLRSEAEKNPNGCLVYADDGEKFGIWPKTHEHCYENGWLKNFFDAVEANSDWLEIVPLSSAAQEKVIGNVFLPTASYAEMLLWALPVEAYKEYEHFENYLKESSLLDRFGRFVRGGHWRMFLSKYEEVNLMHKKMLSVSQEYEEFSSGDPSVEKQIERGKQHLFAGQCNCPYWHGVFGGLYLPHIRSAIFSNLIAAENIIAKIQEKRFNIDILDYDCDGSEEIVMGNETYKAVFKPDRGGMLCELSYLPNPFNLTDTLMRRREGYHNQLEHAVTPEQAANTVSIHDQVMAKESGLGKLLTTDRYLKRCFIDHIFEPDTGFENFDSNDFMLETNLFSSLYAYDTSNEQVAFGYKGNIYRGDSKIEIKLIKIFRLEKNDILVEYRIKSSQPVAVNFGIENNFNFQAPNADDRFILIDGTRHDNSFLSSKGLFDKAKTFSMIDRYRNLGVRVISDRESQIWHTPIYTVSLSEGGFEKVYQGTTFINHFDLNLTDNIETIKIKLTAASEKEIS